MVIKMKQTLKTLAETMHWEVLFLPPQNIEVTGGYCGDLLSHVMSHISKGNLWITVLSHKNVIAVASLMQVSGILLTENITMETDCLDQAKKEGIGVFRTSLSAFEAAYRLGKLFEEAKR